MSARSDGYETVIGLEVHCQLATRSKIFCACSTEWGAAPNTQICPVCAGHPGSLPVLNAQAVEFAARAGLALGAQVRLENVFARKNYFYPDLPKGYQISQFDLPICEGGGVDIEGGRRIALTRIHLEEDAGKSLHYSGYTAIDLNRAGVPLIEIVSEPELRTSAEAGSYLRRLHALLLSLGVTEGNLERGNFRCDVNLSLRRVGATQFGTRVEIKNVNSFRFVEQAIESERNRQAQLLDTGQSIVQETRGFDAASGTTHALRSKEDAHDYRYFADPDVPRVRLTTSELERLRASLPELPEAKVSRYQQELGLSEYDARVLVSAPALAVCFELALGERGPTRAKALCNWISGEVARASAESQLAASPQAIANAVAAIDAWAESGRVSMSGGKAVLAHWLRAGGSAEQSLRALGLEQQSDDAALLTWIDEVIAESPTQVAELKAGKDKVLGFLVGQVMKRSGKRANPGKVTELLRKRVSSP